MNLVQFSTFDTIEIQGCTLIPLQFSGQVCQRKGLPATLSMLKIKKFLTLKTVGKRMWGGDIFVGEQVLIRLPWWS